jgi:ATP-dependent RNA helicase RhlE
VQVGIVAPAHRARQELFELGDADKCPLLLKLLRECDGRVLVFVRTKRGVDRLARTVRARGIDAVRIHGDLEQSSRDKALADFRSGARRVLVATDIAARGLDITGIEHVINYDFPHNAEDYVHRIGRTARVDASGLATSFITRNDKRFVADVRKLIGDKLPQPIRMEGYDAAAAPARRGGGNDQAGGADHLAGSQQRRPRRGRHRGPRHSRRRAATTAN